VRYDWLCWAVLSVQPFAFFALVGCSTRRAPLGASPLDGGRELGAADASGGADVGAANGDASGAQCSQPPVPAELGAGWTPWNTFDPCCGFYVPAPTATPSAIAWEGCDSVAPATVLCRQMLVNWTPSPGERWPLVVSGPGIQQPNGDVSFFLSRAVAGGWERLIADADGPVRLAIFETGACSLQPSSLLNGFYAFGVHMGRAGGAFAGSLDAFPARLMISSHSPMALLVGLPGALDLRTMLLHDWTDPSGAVSVHAPGDHGFLEDFAVFSGNSLFWNASAGCVSKLKAWTQATGTVDFISFGNADASEGVSDIGTDGVDLVWMYGSGGCSAQTLLYQSASIMTSPFTTDLLAVRPRRLRSEIPNGLGVSPFLVNCGYAARQTSQGIRLVRLADGVSWQLAADPSSPWEWEIPLALTCTELFAQVLVHPADGGLGVTKYARVRIDSLGPGSPPD
jgi:hypothetical protein